MYINIYLYNKYILYIYIHHTNYTHHTLHMCITSITRLVTQHTHQSHTQKHNKQKHSNSHTPQNNTGKHIHVPNIRVTIAPPPTNYRLRTDSSHHAACAQHVRPFVVCTTSGPRTKSRFGRDAASRCPAGRGPNDERLLSHALLAASHYGAIIGFCELRAARGLSVWDMNVLEVRTQWEMW